MCEQAMYKPEVTDMRNRPVVISDIAMMTILGGKERSPADLAHLLAASGFKTMAVHEVCSYLSFSNEHLNLLFISYEHWGHESQCSCQCSLQYNMNNGVRKITFETAEITKQHKFGALH
jgi:hypothetical protein